MKKIMIMAVAVVAATIAHAASISWSSAAKKLAPSGDDPSTTGRAASYLVYAFAADTLTAVTASLQAGDVDAAVASSIANVRTSKTGAAAGSFDGLTDGKSYSYYFVAFDTIGNTELSAANNYIMSEAITKVAPGATDPAVSIDITSSNWTANGGWTKIESVPEPTSGLLLLLGMAGLALRRKQA